MAEQDPLLPERAAQEPVQCSGRWRVRLAVVAVVGATTLVVTQSVAPLVRGPQAILPQELDTEIRAFFAAIQSSPAPKPDAIAAWWKDDAFAIFDPADGFVTGPAALAGIVSSTVGTFQERLDAWHLGRGNYAIAFRFPDKHQPVPVVVQSWVKTKGRWKLESVVAGSGSSRQALVKRATEPPWLTNFFTELDATSKYGLGHDCASDGGGRGCCARTSIRIHQ
eukprot:Hpha_TRINITY_DN14274_c0_g1::TRINITY_DN14274_c0_g1_i3::g.22815::m.22815